MSKNNGNTPSVVIDVSTWETMEPILEFQAAANSGNLVALRGIFARVIKAWPYEGDPGDEASYGKIKPKQFTELTQEVVKAVNDLF